MNTAWRRVPTVDVAGLEQASLGGAVVIDVRELDEYESGHVPGALLMPMAEVPVRVGDVPRGETVYLVCETGGRSERAALFMRQAGVDAVNVAGGTRAWIRSGRAVTSGSEPG